MCPQFWTAEVAYVKEKFPHYMEKWQRKENSLFSSLTFTDKRGQYDDIDNLNKLYALTHCFYCLCVRRCVCVCEAWVCQYSQCILIHVCEWVHLHKCTRPLFLQIHTHVCGKHQDLSVQLGRCFFFFFILFKRWTETQTNWSLNIPCESFKYRL